MDNRAGSAGGRPRSAGGGNSKAILVVDDDASICEIIRETLSAEGYQTICASEGESALAAVGAQRLDLILLDVHMPGIDGWDVLNQLRARAGPHQPIVIMTGQYEGQDRALASGAQGYLAKPFDLDDLLECVELHANLRINSNLGEELPARKAEPRA